MFPRQPGEDKSRATLERVDKIREESTDSTIRLNRYRGVYLKKAKKGNIRSEKKPPGHYRNPSFPLKKILGIGNSRKERKERKETRS